MIFFFISILAGILTVLAPCILPLLPILIGVKEEGRIISRRAIRIIFSLVLSIIVFTLFIKSSTLFFTFGPNFWQYFSGILILITGIFITFPKVWNYLPFVNTLSIKSNESLGEGFRKKNLKGDILIGLSLGPVFSTCSPTYLFILATILPSSFSSGAFYLVGFLIGLSVSLLLIAYFGESLVGKLTKNNNTEKLKRIFGLLIILVGILIVTGLDKEIQNKILDSGYGATIEFEDKLIEDFR
jgi:cytochrome c biogenesis protein CcdA